MMKKSKSKRKEITDNFGEDTKFLYHIIRLLDEAEQILLTGDLDLQRAREAMKSVRRGEWTAAQVEDWTMAKDKELEVAYTNCKLPVRPDYETLRTLLLNCLETHYGSLQNCVSETGWAEAILKDIDLVISPMRGKLYGSH